MDSERPVKLACATCIQGHRASTCKHQDGSKGPLLVVKRRGRPLSQCQECREKRIRTGRHTRCDCNNKAKRAAFNAGPSSTTKALGQQASTTSATTAVPAAESSSSSPLKRCSPLSFEFLLNPCSCKKGTVCTCCQTSYDTNKSTPSRTTMKPEPYSPVFQPESKDFLCTQSTHNLPLRTKKEECCSSVISNNVDPKLATKSMDILVRVADMSQEYKPECQCKGICSCKGCMGRSDEKRRQVIPSSSSSGCKSCVACDIRLENPSGIDTVDQWARLDYMPNSMKRSAMI